MSLIIDKAAIRSYDGASSSGLALSLKRWLYFSLILNLRGLWSHDFDHFLECLRTICSSC